MKSNTNFDKAAKISLSKYITEGFEFYIIVKELPPIVLSGNQTSPLCADNLKFKPVKKRVAYIEPTSKLAYDDEDCQIDNDWTKFASYDEAKFYCDELNAREKFNFKV